MKKDVKNVKGASRVELASVSCSCETCKQGCRNGSGFFIDSQLPSVAKFLGISVKKLKENYLELRKVCNTPMWKPKVNNGCIFYKDGCSIHAVKPLECGLAMPCKPENDRILQQFRYTYALNSEDPVSVIEWKSAQKEWS